MIETQQTWEAEEAAPRKTLRQKYFFSNYCLSTLCLTTDPNPLCRAHVRCSCLHAQLYAEAVTPLHSIVPRTYLVAKLAVSHLHLQRR